jgi:hypothetical protein
MEDNQIAEATEKLVHCIGEKTEWLGWRIAQEIANIDTSSNFHELTQEISKTNLILNKINDNLKKIAEKN